VTLNQARNQAWMNMQLKFEAQLTPTLFPKLPISISGHFVKEQAALIPARCSQAAWELRTLL
jgi:hypothetical protein